MKISANGISMNYTLDGPANAPVVTLSHSLATTLAMWEPQLKALTARWRVLAYDTRGHGGTDAPKGGYSLEQLADAAQHEIASAMLPVEGIADVGEDAADATEDALLFVDEVTDVVETRLPGGVIVNRAFDYALIPGRVGVRAVRLVVSFGQAPDRRSGD